MKPCADRKEAIAMLAAGALAAPEAAALRGHLQECAGCNAYASQLNAVCDRLGGPIAGTTAVQPPPGFHARLKHRIQSERPTAAPASILETLSALFTLPRIVSATAILALAVGLAFWMRPDTGSVHQATIQPVPAPISEGNRKVAEPSGGATLMAYQAAFNRSYEDFDALVTQNAARTSTADGMTLMRSGTASF